MEAISRIKRVYQGTMHRFLQNFVVILAMGVSRIVIFLQEAHILAAVFHRKKNDSSYFETHSKTVLQKSALISTFINTKMSVCLFVYLYAFFLAISKPIGLPFGTKLCSWEGSKTTIFCKTKKKNWELLFFWVIFILACLRNGI